MSSANEFTDVPFPFDHVDSEARRILLAGVLENSPPELMDEIADRTDGDQVVFEDVLINCRGNSKLAGLFLDRHMYKLQLDDPKYVRDSIQRLLDATEEQINTMYIEIDGSV